MEDFKPNSHRYKEEQAEKKKINKVVTGEVKTKKKGEIRKLADVFLPEDVSKVKEDLIFDYMVPKIRDVFVDVLKSSIDAFFYNGNISSRNHSTNANYVSYNHYSNSSSNTRRTQASAGYSFEDIVLTNRQEADAVLASMDDLINEYGIASVADLYDLVGLAGRYTDCKYGWTDLRRADVVHTREGWLLRLPKTVPLN